MEVVETLKAIQQYGEAKEKLEKYAGFIGSTFDTIQISNMEMLESLARETGKEVLTEERPDEYLNNSIRIGNVRVLCLTKKESQSASKQDRDTNKKS